MSFMHGSENLPILFENDKFVVYKNPTDEIFVQTKNEENPVQLRISSHGKSILVLPGYHGSQIMVPACFNGVAGVKALGWMRSDRKE